MKEESGEPRSPRHRSRSPIDRARSPEQRDAGDKEIQGDKGESQEIQETADKEALDSYSASLRLASLETLTGKPPASLASLAFPFGPTPGLPAASAASTSASKVPSEPSLSLQDALLNFQKTASSYPGPGLMANPLASLLASQGAGGLSGLPKPADLIQQAQTLQLLAHLQTMLMNPGGGQAGQAGAPGPLPSPLNNAANFQKVCFIHIYEEAQNK